MALVYIEDEFEKFWAKHYSQSNYSKNKVKSEYWFYLDHYNRFTATENKILEKYPV